MAPYVPIPAGFHDVVQRQIVRYGTDLAAEICGSLAKDGRGRVGIYYPP